MQTLVTGVSGFVGKSTCTELLRRGMLVRAAVRNHVNFPEGAELVYVGDIGADTDWREALLGVDVVVHLAAKAHVVQAGADALSSFRRVNTDGTLQLARQALEVGVRRFVFISSIGVNGFSTDQKPFVPDDLPAPHSPYAQSKYEAEQGLLALAAESNLEVVIIRPPLVYGFGAPGNFGSLARWISRGRPLPLGAVNNSRSFVALDNLVDFIALCADREKSPKAANEIFLISDGEDISTSELLRRIAHAYGKPSRLINVPVGLLRLGAKLTGKSKMAESLLGSLVIDSSKATTLLGWKPVVTMQEQLARMAAELCA
jgi:nucleoside-diphosphate-sugar epimerase